jgi:hypothetical protein
MIFIFYNPAKPLKQANYPVAFCDRYPASDGLPDDKWIK